MRKWMYLCLTVLLLGGTAAYWIPIEYAVVESAAIASSQERLEFLIATDLHYQREASEISAALIPQVAYINEIMEAFVDDVMERNPAVLILCGDLTNNGRVVEHVELIKKLSRLMDAGIQVLVVPGNHDITQQSAERFPLLYASCGYGDALYRDAYSLSYVAAVSDDIWWIMLDTNLQGAPQHIANGIIVEETAQWIEAVLKEAQSSSITVFAAGHHNLLTPNPDLYGQLDGYETVNSLFAAYGVPVYASGHRHHHSVRGGQAGDVWELSGGMLADYPNFYGQLSVNMTDRIIAYEPQCVDVQSWAVRNGSTDPNLIRFSDFSRQCNKGLCDSIATGIIKAMQISQSQKDSIAGFLSEAYMAYYDGTLEQKREELSQSEGYVLWMENSGESKYETLFYIMMTQYGGSDNSFSSSF